MGFQLSDSFCMSLSGLPGGEVVRRLHEHCGTGFDGDRFFAVSGEIWQRLVRSEGIPVKRGFHSLLACVRERGLPYALATNSRRADAERCLSWAGLDAVFPIMICREDAAYPKPAPDIFLRSAEKLGVEPQDCLVLEDSPVGIAAATAANCPSILVPSVLPADPNACAQARLVMQDLAQVAEFISAGFRDSL
jgi:HAD superfamily hydrolase (TIGR01509 family)